MGGVDVLDQGHLVAGGSSLTGGDGGISKEEFPDSVPSVAILGLDLVLVGEPVSVPSPESGRVVDTNGIDSLDLPSSTLDSADVVVERAGSVSTREDVLVHEKTPDEILVLPALSQSSDLEEKNSVVIHHIVTLLQERSKMSHTNVLSHLETGDLLVFAFWDWDVTVIHAENLALLLGDASLAKSIVTPSSLVATESDSSSPCTVVDTGEFGKSSPSTADI